MSRVCRRQNSMFTKLGPNHTIAFVADGQTRSMEYARDRCGIPEWMHTLLVSPVEAPEPVEAPGGYMGVLRPYQQAALGFALHRKRTMLALDCGLGKTHVGIAYMLLQLPALVVCPASLVASWHEHLLSFAPALAAQITVCSYNKMQPTRAVRCIVVDEAHYLKHESSKRSKTFQRMLAHDPAVLLLTGTPAQRNMDMFNILKILYPAQITHFFHHNHAKTPGVLYFAERYTMPKPVWIGGAQHGFKFTGNRHSEELALLAERVVLRMKKHDVVQLPPFVTRAVIIGTAADPTDVMRKWAAIEEVREQFGSRRADVELMALCRQTAHTKVPLVIVYIQNWLAMVRDDKLLVFYHHKSIGQQLVQAVGPHIHIDGKTPMKTRVQRIHSFRHDPACRVAVLSMCACSTGLNLQFCTKIMFVEMTFLSVHHTQAEARIHRIGQDKDVSVDYLLMDHTTDTILWKSLLAKRQVEAQLFDQSSL